MSNIAIIPARGGSKRILRKNIKHFLEKPILAYAIENALNSNLFDEVMVSTDDEEIASVALKYGAKIPFIRSDQNANDTATTVDVLKEVLNYYSQKNIQFKYACCIYPCTPLLNRIQILNAFNKLNEGNYDCVFPVVKYSTPIQRALKTDGDKIKMFNSNFLNERSQDLVNAYYDAGQFYFFDINALIKNNRLWTDNTSFIEMDEISVQDIDNENDWKMAELKYNLLKQLDGK